MRETFADFTGPIAENISSMVFEVKSNGTLRRKTFCLKFNMFF